VDCNVSKVIKFEMCSNDFPISQTTLA